MKNVLVLIHKLYIITETPSIKQKDQQKTYFIIDFSNIFKDFHSKKNLF
jgi:hypothetical protein